MKTDFWIIAAICAALAALAGYLAAGMPGTVFALGLLALLTRI